MLDLVLMGISFGIIVLVDLAVLPMSLCFLLGHGENVSFSKKDLVISDILVVLSDIILTIITIMKIIEAKNIAIGSADVITIVVTVFTTIIAFVLGILLINKLCHKEKSRTERRSDI